MFNVYAGMEWPRLGVGLNPGQLHYHIWSVVAVMLFEAINYRIKCNIRKYILMAANQAGDARLN